MNLKKSIIFTYLVLAFSITAWSQTKADAEDEILTQSAILSSEVNLAQFGNQNTADIVQLQSFSAQLNLTQKGSSHYATIFQYGSGRISVGQYGAGNYIDAYIVGENMDIELYQKGGNNEIRNWSNGDNPTYQFSQFGTENVIDHIHSGSNDSGLVIQQRGNNMNITIRTN